jgi:hypothetical protein
MPWTRRKYTIDTICQPSRRMIVPAHGKITVDFDKEKDTCAEKKSD